MTCIVALKENDKIYIAYDSFIGDDFTHNKTNFDKVIGLGEFTIGLTGYPRGQQLIENYLTVKPQKAQQLDINYLVVEFANNLKEISKEHGYSIVNNNQEETEDILLLVYKKNIYKISCNYQVNQYQDDFLCIGSGTYHATGAMAALKTSPPDFRVKRAIEIAAQYCNTVCEPIKTMVIE